MLSKVLYVSPIWTNLAKYKLSDNAESGMPAFSEPLKYFLGKGIDINVLWIEDSSSPKLEDPLLASQSKIFVRSSSKWGLICSFFKVFIVTTFEIRKQKPAVIFCHGALSVGAILAAFLLRKRAVVRVYGTNKYANELIRLGSRRFFFKYPFVFLMFFIASDALIATDDGSRADEIFSRIGSAKEFYYLKNGLPKNVDVNNSSRHILLCVGRIERKKNQIFAIDFFNKIAKKNDDILLKFIGEVSCAQYLSELELAIEKSNFSSRIKIVGPLRKVDLCRYYSECEAVLSFQENSNFGNVAIECLHSGCLFITFKEDSFVNLSRSSNNPVALLGESVSEIAELYKSLGIEEKQNIRNNGRYSIAAELDPWADRAARELDILLRVRDV
jgi:glycosyltransferase involved in cell wall biosynthesis